jgi:hypothetical protein
MKFLSRLVMVLVMLGGLAYGSYAVGKYILSNRLFGSSMSRSKSRLGNASIQSRVAPSVTRRTTIKGNKPRVEMEVLPAQEAGPGPEPPPISALERITATKNHTSNPLLNPPSGTGSAPGGSSRTSGPALGTRRFDSASAASSGSREDRVSSNDDEERPRRRRRRRRRSYSEDESSSTSSSRRYRRRSTRRERRSGSYQSQVARSEGYSSARRSTTRESSGGGTESPVPVPE